MYILCVNILGLTFKEIKKCPFLVTMENIPAIYSKILFNFNMAPQVIFKISRKQLIMKCSKEEVMLRIFLNSKQSFDNCKHTQQVISGV